MDFCGFDRILFFTSENQFSKMAVLRHKIGKSKKNYTSWVRLVQFIFERKRKSFTESVWQLMNKESVFRTKKENQVAGRLDDMYFFIISCARAWNIYLLRWCTGLKRRTLHFRNLWLEVCSQSLAIFLSSTPPLSRFSLCMCFHGTTDPSRITVL